MHIWNRAERVREELMPSRIIECFAEWKADELAKLDSLIIHEDSPPKLRKKIEAQRHGIESRIEREGINLELAVTKFNNRKKVA
jgi:hypothetical protein